MRQVMMMMIVMVMIIAMMMMMVMVIMSNYAKCPADGSERKSFGADQSNPERGGRGEKDFHYKKNKYKYKYKYKYTHSITTMLSSLT